MLGEMRNISRHEACSLGRAACFLVHAEGTGTATFLTVVTGASHVAFGLIEFVSRELVAAEALAGVLGPCNGEAAPGTERDAGLVGNVIAVEVAPLWKRSRRDSVNEAAGVGET